jgi:uncharacterized protein
MPVSPTYPGVYIEEIPSGVRTITGVSTSITAFIGRAVKGPLNTATRIQSFGDFERQFGGLWEKSPMTYAVDQYFRNGGQDAIIVRVYKAMAGASDDGKTSITLGDLVLQASSPGVWGKTLRAAIDHNTKEDASANPKTLFNLSVQQVRSPNSNDVIATETLRNLSIDASSPRYFVSVIAQSSVLVDVQPGLTLSAIPRANDTDSATQQLIYTGADQSKGDDGADLSATEVEGSESDRTGLYALEQVDLFNLLCIPPLSRDTDVSDSTLQKAIQYCLKRRAMLLVDPPATWTKISDAEGGVDQLRSTLGGEAIARNAAVFFPRLKMADPLKDNRTEEFVPCGVVAGIFARTDATRGVWKAPAGIEAAILGVRELSYKLTDGENGRLNPKALNCIRFLRDYGNVVWGARTVAGSDALASEWKYIPVRRLALFLEESLYRGTQWVVFEPNDEPLWAQIRLNIGAFMNNLFRQGAFQGKTPREAYFVKCDKETTTQNDIDRGIVNIIVGFAPLKPAEFVIIKFQQIAGQIET